MPLIETNVIQGGAVYGVAQMSYTVDGAAGKDYSAALAAAALKESTAIEAAAASYTEVVRVRERKVTDLGEALAYLNKALSTLRVKNAEPGDKTSEMYELATAHSLLSKYGISLNWSSYSSDAGGDKMSMTRANIMKAQNDVQYALDTEDNNLQQDLVALKGLISKRDSAFSAASRIVKKADNAASATIGNIV
ncbi:MAG: hypothetical protein IJV65_06935 [Kiritimatiellae bacterium]|nr:hypothetical protein [Kiritimatiellia bacterium]